MQLLVIIMICIIAALLAWPTMLLWNWLIPHIFGLITIDFWEALGLLLLSGFLIKSTSSKSN